MDSETNPDDDITPFKNILNEMYAKDCSRKIKAVVKAKGNSGKHITTIPPLGYMKDPDDKEKWIVDEEGAAIVKEIFSLCVKGYGPSQIARILTKNKVETPTVYRARKKMPCPHKLNEKSEIWDYKSVAGILEDMQYLGHTVNFRSYKKSYKAKRRIDAPKEDWVIFENTQEPIIDKETFDIVQKIRESRRRPTGMGEMSVLFGMLYCADCGRKMYLCRCTTMKQAEYFNCSGYRKNLKRTCSSHQITVRAVEEMIKNDLQFTIRYASENKEQFLSILTSRNEAKSKRELKASLREIDESEARIKTLDKIIQSLYEDKVADKLSEDRYMRMSENYENEQRLLMEKVSILKTDIEKSKSKSDDISRFILLVDKYSDFGELTPEILRAFIDKVLIYEKQKVDGHYRHTIEIIYNFVGAVEIPDFD